MKENLVKEAIAALVKSELDNNPTDYCKNDYAQYNVIVSKLKECIIENKADFASFNSKLVKLVEYDNSEISEYVDENYSDEICCTVETGNEFLKLYNKVLIDYTKEKMKEAIEELKDLKLEERLYFFLKLKELNIKPTKELYEKFCNCGEDKSAFVRELNIDSVITY